MHTCNVRKNYKCCRT